MKTGPQSSRVHLRTFPSGMLNLVGADAPARPGRGRAPPGRLSAETGGGDGEAPVVMLDDDMDRSRTRRQLCEGQDRTSLDRWWGINRAECIP
jgi:hypothetical protein